ncbi:MAG: anti-sigma F factor [Bacillota bacterium]|nr:anti-sigma F factor [Bacillota bacterium]
MAGETNRFVLDMPALPENVGLARLVVAGLAAQLPFTVSDVEELKVAVSEAVTNVVLHAYAGTDVAPEERLLQVRGLLFPDRIEVEVADWGRGIEDLDRAREPAFTTAPERMGLGFAFMESFADGVEVESRPGEGTRVRLVKRLQAEGAGAAGVAGSGTGSAGAG